MDSLFLRCFLLDGENFENTGYRKSYLRRKGIYVMKTAIYQGKIVNGDFVYERLD